MDVKRKNRNLALVLAGIACGMVGMAYLSVPLYQLFCQVTGFGGTPNVDQQAQAPGGDGTMMTIRFNADITKGLKWEFKPDQKAIQIPIGEEGLTFYKARNLDDSTTRGVATFNVTPLKAAPYFVKVDCFCFSDQSLALEESADLPVTFYVDPAILTDPTTREVRTITLSYTFFPAKEDSNGNDLAAAPEEESVEQAIREN
ncbi:cytochrome c oxidase assembly protein [Aestuariispira insulae]|uniref:Cytochrome c oxidase assembly protein CtaG n=1 Tax=Aestuariispira insulae TaxID=1461337 RepID=A0A3D9HPK6_9PROT|nr:cytochrome c oxidase assembly protein [Aestuariispira insulae]RED50836.1 cytochrome c oxidase assembly protein subunit 11 [Aestuariispira insulae]